MTHIGRSITTLILVFLAYLNLNASSQSADTHVLSEAREQGRATGRAFASRGTQLQDSVAAFLSDKPVTNVDVDRFLDGADLLLWWTGQDAQLRVARKLRRLAPTLGPSTAKRARGWAEALELTNLQNQTDVKLATEAITAAAKDENKKTSSGPIRAAHQAFERAIKILREVPASEERDLLIGLATEQDVSLDPVQTRDAERRLNAILPSTPTDRTAPVIMEAMDQLLSSRIERNDDNLAAYIEVADNASREWRSKNIVQPPAMSIDPTIAFAAVKAGKLDRARVALHSAVGFMEGFGSTSEFGLTSDGLMKSALDIGDFAIARDLIILDLKRDAHSFDLFTEMWAEAALKALGPSDLDLNSTALAVVLSAVAARPDLAPYKSPVWRRVLFKLAEAFERAGSTAAAISTRLRASEAPLPDLIESQIRAAQDADSLVRLSQDANVSKDRGAVAALGLAALQLWRRQAASGVKLTIGMEELFKHAHDAAFSLLSIGQSDQASEAVFSAIEILEKSSAADTRGGIRQLKFIPSLFDDFGQNLLASEIRFKAAYLDKSHIMTTFSQHSSLDYSSFFDIQSLSNEFVTFKLYNEALSIWKEVLVSVLNRKGDSRDLKLTLEELAETLPRISAPRLGSMIYDISTPVPILGEAKDLGAVCVAITAAFRSNIADLPSSLADNAFTRFDCAASKGNASPALDARRPIPVDWKTELSRLRIIASTEGLGLEPNGSSKPITKVRAEAREKLGSGDIDF